MSDAFTVKSNVRDYALVCSKANRAGKFKRVSEDFLTDIETAVDCLIRQIETKVGEPLHPLPKDPQKTAIFGGTEPVERLRLVTGFASERAHARLEAAIRKIIANKVQGTPTCGQTL